MVPHKKGNPKIGPNIGSPITANLFTLLVLSNFLSTSSATGKYFIEGNCSLKKNEEAPENQFAWNFLNNFINKALPSVQNYKI